MSSSMYGSVLSGNNHGKAVAPYAHYTVYVYMTHEVYIKLT